MTISPDLLEKKRRLEKELEENYNNGRTPNGLRPEYRERDSKLRKEIEEVNKEIYDSA